MTSSVENPHLGTALDDFLAEDGLLESASRTAASRTSAWQEDEYRSSLWQVAQSGYDVFVFQDGGPLVRVTDENAGGLGIYATEWDGEQGFVYRRGVWRTYLNLAPTQPSTFYVVHSAASSPDHWPHELCVNRRGAAGDTVYMDGFGYMFCGSHEAGHAIRLGGTGGVYRASGDGHAIRHDGAGQLRGGECYDLIRHHLGRIADVAQVNLDAPAFDPGRGDVERSPGHAGIALRGGDGPGLVCGDNCQDHRPRRGRRKLPLHPDWPLDEEERKDREMEYCFRSWSASDSSLDRGDLVCVSRGEMPDRAVRNERTGEEYGVELTSVCLHDRSVMDHHRVPTSEMKPRFMDDPEKVRDYLRCIAKKVREKVGKARSYDHRRDLILAVHLNERILSPDFTGELQEFIRRHQAFRRIAPFARVVFTGNGHGVVYP